MKRTHDLTVLMEGGRSFSIPPGAICYPRFTIKHHLLRYARPSPAYAGAGLLRRTRMYASLLGTSQAPANSGICDLHLMLAGEPGDALTDRFRQAIRYLMVDLGCLLCLIAVGLWGCAGTAPSRYYGLSPMAAPESNTPHSIRPFTVGITRVMMPDFLDRPQIATRVGPHEIRYDEYNRWAEPLKDNFSRVLAENLCSLLGPDQVLVSTRGGALSADYHVWVEVNRFDAAPEGDFSLTARWSLYSHEKKKVIVRTNFNTREPANGSDYAAMTAAASKALAALSRQIAEGLKNLP